MIIHIPKISPDGSQYSGKHPPEMLDLNEDRFMRAQSPVIYDFKVQIVSDQVIVQGTLETSLELLCVACADFFSTSITVSSFLRAYTLQSGLETIDITDEIREEILLAVPYYPRGELDENEVCKQCGKTKDEIAVKPEPEEKPAVWDKLDNLEL